jgi:hypothetical protein
VGSASSEHREDRVADELLDNALIALDGTGQQAERLVDAANDLLCVELGHEPRVVHDVREQGRDDPAVAGNGRADRQASGALVAEARGRCIRCAARRAPDRSPPTSLPVHGGDMVRRPPARE